MERDSIQQNYKVENNSPEVVILDDTSPEGRRVFLIKGTAELLDITDGTLDPLTENL